MESALSELEFLARSENRVRVLQLLAAEEHTRDALGDATNVSQATLSRILKDFQTRSWVRQTDTGYVATATGSVLADGLTDVLRTIETEQKLRAVVPYLPAAAFEFDLTALADATITVPTQTKPTAPLKRVLDHIRTSETLRAVSHTFNERSLAVVTDQVKAGAQTFEGVFAEETITTLAADPESWTRLTELAASDNAQLWVREADVPVAAVLNPDVVTFLLRGENGLIQAAVETDSQSVRNWVANTIDRYQATATPFTPAAYAPDTDQY